MKVITHGPEQEHEMWFGETSGIKSPSAMQMASTYRFAHIAVPLLTSWKIENAHSNASSCIYTLEVNVERDMVSAIIV